MKNINLKLHKVATSRSAQEKRRERTEMREAA